MPRQIGPRQIGSIVLVSAVIVAGAGVGLPAGTARAADECLAAPNAQAPKGSHWYYRLDRANQRKCWYMRAPGPAAQQAAPQALPDAIAAATPLPPEVSNYANDSVAPAPQVEQRPVKPKAATMTAAPPDGAVRAAEENAQPADTQPVQAPAAAVAWPDPAPQIQTLRRAEPGPRDARADAAPLRPVANARAAGGAQAAVPNGEAAGTGGFLALTPVGIVLIGALALAMAGVLTRAVVRIASVRRRRVHVEQSDPHWIDDIPPEPMHAYAAPPLDPSDAPIERPGPSIEEVEVALRNILRSYDRRVA